MYEFNSTICISGSELIRSDINPGGFLSKSNYDKLSRLKRLDIKRKGCYGTPALIAVDSLPAKYQELIKNKYGSLLNEAAKRTFTDEIFRDAKAVEYFTAYRLEDGRALPVRTINQYSNDASILNAFKSLINNTNKHRAIGAKVKQFWPKAIAALANVAALYPNSLPTSEKRLKCRYEAYMKALSVSPEEGYRSLISRKFNNDNSRKVTALIERMLLSLYAMPNKPFGSSVHEMYLSFLNGGIDIVDKLTGEFFNRSDFQRNGQPVEISDTTVWNYINNPLNRILVDKSRLDGLDYNNTHRPHHRRHAPNFSFSKVSMDDRDLPRKIINGGRVKAYYAYDVTSGAIVGVSYSRDKDEELFLSCLRDMFRLMDTHDWGVPMEVEVENHLVSKFFDELGRMFPILRICAPGNSQEKHAEHFNKAKKYGTEKKTQISIGRWWAKGEAYRTRTQKVSNEFTEKAYSYDLLVADDQQAVKDYNNALHPRQKKYPGMTRWQVLCNNINPKIIRPNRALWIKSIGNHTVTSIKRSGYITANYNEYRLPGPDVIGRLKPNNYTVDAYWLPDEKGNVAEIYLYQHGEFLCRCEAGQTYNTAKSEWNKDDSLIFSEQAGYISKFDKLVAAGRADKIIKPEIITAAMMTSFTPLPVEITISKPHHPIDFDIDAALKDYAISGMTAKGIESI